MTSEFFRHHWFWNQTKIATYRRPRGAYDIEALNVASKLEGASRVSSQNLELLFNIDEHLTSCVRMDVLQYEEGLKSISLFLRAWLKFVRFFWDTRYTEGGIR